MFDLFVGIDTVQRQIKESLEPKGSAAGTSERWQWRRRRVALRSSAAAGLRVLAELVEPS
jgi:hypothetical protein